MIWSFLYWVLLVLAVLVGLRALLWDRAGLRGRAALRCRKCWYDLTGASGDLRVKPIVCPECGKKHASRRAMRKTRRAKKLIVVALLIFLSADSVRSIPMVKRGGWMMMIPRPVLVLAIPIFDDTEGSSYDMTMWGGGQITVSGRIAKVVSHQSLNLQRSWVADRLVFILARLESSRVITDSTTDRGAIYMGWINSAIRNNAAYGFEKRWARSVLYAEFPTNERVAPGTTVFGKLKIRRLMQGVYRADVGMNLAWFEARTANDSDTTGIRISSGPGIRSVEMYLGQQWDRLRRLPRIPYGESSQGEMTVIRYWLDPSATGVQTGSVPVTIYERVGDLRLGVQWEKVASVNVSYRFIADPDAGPRIVEDPKLSDILEGAIRAELGFRFNRESSTWEMVAYLKKNGLQLSKSVTFGGDISIEVQRRVGKEVSYSRVLRGPKKWWRWEPPTRPPEGMDEKEGEFWKLFNDGALIASWADSNTDDAWGVSFEDNGYSIQYRNTAGRLVLRVRADSDSHNQIVFSDSQAEQVLIGDLVFPIKNWTIEELNRYRLGGAIPDHAMP